MTRTTLIEAAQDFAAVEQLLLESQGELTPELEAWLTEVESNVADRVDAYVMVQERLKEAADFYKTQADKFLAAKKASENAVERMKERIRAAMTTMGTDELRGEAFRFKMSNAPKRLVIDNEDTVPMAYKSARTVYDLAKDGIKVALEGGSEIPGCHLEGGKSIRSYVNKPESKKA